MVLGFTLVLETVILMNLHSPKHVPVATAR